MKSFSPSNQAKCHRPSQGKQTNTFIGFFLHLESDKTIQILPGYLNLLAHSADIEISNKQRAVEEIVLWPNTGSH
jgi:hypothetical protein